MIYYIWLHLTFDLHEGHNYFKRAPAMSTPRNLACLYNSGQKIWRDSSKIYEKPW